MTHFKKIKNRVLTLWGNEINLPASNIKFPPLQSPISCFNYSTFLYYLFLIGGYIVFVSAIHQHESAISIRRCTYVPSFLKLSPTSHPTPPL